MRQQNGPQHINLTHHPEQAQREQAVPGSLITGIGQRTEETVQEKGGYSESKRSNEKHPEIPPPP